MRRLDVAVGPLLGVVLVSYGSVASTPDSSYAAEMAAGDAQRGGLRPAALSAAMREWLRATSTLVAAVLVLVGLVFVYLESQSPSRVYWVGDTTSGTIRDGLVYYRVDGQGYTINTDRYPARPTPITVYYEPSDPSQALYSRPTRWVEAGAIAVWFVVAAVVLAAAPVRRRRARRRGATEPDWARAYLTRDPSSRPRT